MTTATARYSVNGLTVTAFVQARPLDLSEDAERGAKAAADALAPLRLTRPIARGLDSSTL